MAWYEFGYYFFHINKIFILSKLPASYVHVRPRRAAETKVHCNDQRKQPNFFKNNKQLFQVFGRHGVCDANPPFHSILNSKHCLSFLAHEKKEKQRQTPPSLHKVLGNDLINKTQTNNKRSTESYCCQPTMTWKCSTYVNTNSKH